MEVKAVLRYRRVQPRKVRLVCEKVKGKPALYSAHLLKYHTSKGARDLRKALLSAIANAQENHSIPAESLQIVRLSVDEGPRLKRIQARAQGRANQIIKRTSHITVVLDEMEASPNAQQPKSKPKARPTFTKLANAAKKKAGKEAVKPVEEELNASSGATSEVAAESNSAVPGESEAAE
jgi:large subunit ribosomal protein L22